MVKKRVVGSEKTLTVIKPDGVGGRLIGEVVKRLERKGVEPVAMKMALMSSQRARLFYKNLKSEIPDSVFDSLIEYVTSDRIVVIVWQGNGVVSKVRRIIGPTDPKKAKKAHVRSLSKESLEKRFDRGEAVRNIIHASATVKEAKREIDFFFRPGEICKL